MKCIIKIWLMLFFLWLPVVHAQTFERILALTPHVCDMLDAIDATSKVVGVVSYCDDPKKDHLLPEVGSYKGIHVESALRLKPDVAIVLNRAVRGVAQLEQAGVHIVVSNPESFDDIFSDILMIGDLTGHQAQAKVLVNKQRQRLQVVRQHRSPHVRVFYELWSKPMLTVGGRGFIHQLIQEAGGDNVFAHIPLEAPRVNVESVIRAKPRLIIVPLEKRDLHEREIFWWRWLGKGQVRIVAMNPDLLHRPGPRLLEGLEQLQITFSREGQP